MPGKSFKCVMPKMVILMHIYVKGVILNHVLDKRTVFNCMFF